jgi:tetratricopeptide (TPR) repeat protein
MLQNTSNPPIRRSLAFLLIVGLLGLASYAQAQTTIEKPIPPEARPAPQSATPAESAAAPGQTLLAPNDPLAIAKTLLRKGDFDAATKKYRQFLEENPKSPDAYAGLTLCYLKQQNVTQAFDTVTRALQVADSPPVRVALGEVYFRQGKIPEAEKEWVDVLKAGNPAARAYLGLARVRWAIEMNKTGKLLIDKAHELDPDDPDIQLLWIRTLSRSERIKKYEAYLADAASSNSDERTDLERYLARLKDQQNRHDPHCRLVSKVKSTETPLVRLMIDPSHLRGYGLSVALNGVGTKIMLDTGASGIVVKRQTAEKAGIGKIAETKMGGIGDKGARDAFVGTAQSIRIGDLEFQNCPVRVLESRSVAGEDGLIGSDVFEDFLVEIDFPNEKLKLGELPKRPGQSDQQLTLKNDEGDAELDDQPQSDKADQAQHASNDPKPSAPSTGLQDRYISPEMQSFTRVYRFGHDLLVPTRVGDVPGKLFLLDTGSLTNFISPAAAREVTKVHGDSDTTVKGISGSVKNIYSANKAVLQFGRLRQENQDMTSFDMTRVSEDDGTEVSGFFGFVMLRFLDIKIDYRDGLVDFAYDAQRFGR